MKTLIKLVSILIIFNGFASSANAFDLKSLTDKIQKDIGNKLQVPKGGSNSGNSNPLGDLMKNLNTNTAGTSVNMGNTSQPAASGSSFVTAEQMCNTHPNRILKKGLPKGSISALNADFKSGTEISKIFENLPSQRDEFVQNLNNFSGAFETKEVEELFSAFIAKRGLDELAALQALTTLEPGFNKNKKQIKADATFAYGLIHFFYGPNGSNKQLGINLIKRAAGTPNNIGALTLYGAWQFYGTNVPENIEAGNANALEGYNRQSEKNRETNVTGPYYQMKKSTYPENVFLNIADNNKNPYKAQYQNQLAQAKKMQKDVQNQLQNSKRYDAKFGFWPTVVKNQDFLNDIVTKMIENKGLGEKIKPLKAKYEVYKTKTATTPNDAQVLKEKNIINDTLVQMAEELYSDSKTLDDKGKKQIKILAKNNELLILKGERTAAEVTVEIFARGGFGLDNALFVAADLMNNLRINTCKVYRTVHSYAERTNVPLGDPLTNDNIDDEPEDLGGTG